MKQILDNLPKGSTLISHKTTDKHVHVVYQLNGEAYKTRLTTNIFRRTRLPSMDENTHFLSDDGYKFGRITKEQFETLIKGGAVWRKYKRQQNGKPITELVVEIA